jgi:hypothetical protein
MSALNPTLAGAVAKAERGIAFLKLPGATSDHMRQAMDCLKSAGKLAASHHIVLVELEDQVPEPGPALFDGTGAPAPGAVVAGPEAGTSDEVILQMTGKEYDELVHPESQQAERDLMFAARMHFRARGLSLEKWHAFEEEMERWIVFGEVSWNWLVGQIRTAGDFDWPTRCAGGCGTAMDADDDGSAPTCFRCEQAQKKAGKAEKPKARKKQNPLETQATPE